MKGSLQQALTRWLLPSLLCALALGAAGAYLVGQHAAQIAYDQALMAAAEDVALGVRFREHQPGLELSDQSERMLRSDVRDEIFFAVRSEQGAYIAGDADLPSAPLVSLAEGTSTEREFRGERVRALSMRFDRDEAPYVVTVAETVHKRSEMARSVLLFTLAPAALVLALAGTLVWFAVRRGLQPLALLQRALQQRSATDLSPIDLAQVPQEVRSLVQTLNDLLQRLDQAARAQQMFIADAAHQLRTPLAGIQTQVELLATLEPSAQPAMVQRLRAAVGRTIRLTHQLLALTRSERDRVALSFKPLDLSDLVDDAADDWVHRAIARGVDLGFDLASARTQGEALLLHEMMDNLVDNALRYGRRGGNVTISTATQGNSAMFCVEDSGPGIPESERGRVMERFYRMPDSPGEGSGLGLAIVRQIAAQHQGTVTIGDSPLGGARVCVALPAASSCIRST